MGRTFVFAVDSTKAAHRAAKWCCDTLVRPTDQLHLLVVSTGAAFGSSITPVASSNAKREQSLEAIANTKAVHEVLHLASAKVAQEQFTVACLKAAPGSKGVAKAVVAYARLHHAQLIVLGSRGMSDFSSSLMCLVGLGSVSSLVVEDAPCPVAIVRGSEADTKSKGEGHVMLVVEESTTRDVLQWTLDNAVRPDEDHLHILTIGHPTAKLSEIAGQRLPPERIIVDEGPRPQEPSSEICRAVVQYAQEHHISLAILARYEQHGLVAALRRLAGQGCSLGELLLRHLDCPAILLRD